MNKTLEKILDDGKKYKIIGKDKNDIYYLIEIKPSDKTIKDFEIKRDSLLDLIKE